MLKKPERVYLECLEVNHLKLEDLLRQDEAHWAERQEMSKLQEIEDQIGAMMER